MHAPSSFLANPDPAPSQATMPGVAPGQAPPPDQCTRKGGRGLLHWFQQNSFAPGFLPKPLRHPLFGYLAALLMELIAGSLILLLVSLFPTVVFRGILTDVGVVLVAVIWGAGPSLFATLVGTFLLYYVLLPPYFTWVLGSPANGIELVLYLVVGVSISLIASRSEGARRQLEAKHLLLLQAEALSRFESQRLRTVLDVLPSAVAIADKAGRLLEVNPALRTIWGQQMPLASGITQYGLYRGWWAKTGQPVAAEEWGLARALTRGEVSLNEEVEIETFAGQRKTILNSAAPIRDETGAITGAVVGEQDISELRRLEREVAERAQELEAIFESMTDAVFVFDAAGRIRRVNAFAREILGPEQARWQDRSMQERFASLLPRDQDTQVVPFEHLPAQRVLRGEVLTGAQAVDVLYLRAEGHTLVASFSGTPLRDATGAITGAVLVAHDVTERRQLERRTREALNTLVAMGEAMIRVSDGQEAEAPPCVTVRATAHRLAELTHRVVDCQRVTISLLDPEAETLQPLVASDCSPEQEADWATRLQWVPLVARPVDPALVARLHAGEALTLDLTQLPPTNARTYLGTATLLTAPLIIGSRLLGLLSVHHTQTGHAYPPEEVDLVSAVARLAALVIERERLLDEREAARAAALAERETNHQMDAFLSMVSHELKQPLTVLQGHLQLAQRRIGRLGAASAALPPADLAAKLAPLEEHLTGMARQTERQEGLINDLLDAARIRTGKLAIHPAPMNLLPLVRGAVEEQCQLAPERVIRLDLPAIEDIPVLADGHRLEQVVTNYLTNALKYSLASCPVEVGVTREDRQVRVWVRDQGPGLAPDQQQRIFDRFYRAPGIEVQSGTGIGLGLGLYICRTLIEQQGGQVGVESTPGQGSTFWFTLPLFGAEHRERER